MIRTVTDKIIYKDDSKNTQITENKDSSEEELKVIEEEIPAKLKITKNNFDNNNNNHVKDLINNPNPKLSQSIKRSSTPQKKERKKSSAMNSSLSQGVFNINNGTPRNTNKTTNPKGSTISPNKNRESNNKKNELSLLESSSVGNNFNNILKKKK